ncbi:ComF family protein [Listeria ivanovii]|uniref:ComF family protein n=1 Tax=Listeria ivanovii TaxID=1638 RepID=UPI001623971B|nr:ComF family protein [Listeria ivanovii]MBC2255015.1 ComF family protein [Listeria ivanovii]
MNNCLLCLQPLKVDVGWHMKWLFETKPICCSKCFANFEPLEGPLCELCSKESVNKICLDCQYKSSFLDNNKSLYRYNDFAKAYMRRYKFQGDYVIGAIFHNELKRLLVQDDAIIVPIPVSAERKLERGFNQTIGMLKQAGIKYEELLARNHSEKQSKKTKKERLEREQVFYLQKEGRYQQTKVILFDDIYTTGSTLNLAAQEFKKVGVKQVTAVTIFR